MTCNLCKIRGKEEWMGDDPACAFDGNFDDNWNCATLDLIREICDDAVCVGVDGIDYRFCDDQKYCTLNVSDVAMSDGEVWFALWVSWYKSRGNTDAMWLLTDDKPPRRPTEEECVRIAAWFNARAAEAKQ